MWVSRRYLEHLEAEIARLQLRERELLNVILPKEGFRPLDETRKEHKPEDMIPRRRKETALQYANRKARSIIDQGRQILLDRRIIVGSKTGVMIDLGDRDQNSDGKPAASNT